MIINFFKTLFSIQARSHAFQSRVPEMNWDLIVASCPIQDFSPMRFSKDSIFLGSQGNQRESLQWQPHPIVLPCFVTILATSCLSNIWTIAQYIAVLHCCCQKAENLVLAADVKQASKQCQADKQTMSSSTSFKPTGPVDRECGLLWRTIGHILSSFWPPSDMIKISGSCCSWFL